MSKNLKAALLIGVFLFLSLAIGLCQGIANVHKTVLQKQKVDREYLIEAQLYK